MIKISGHDFNVPPPGGMRSFSLQQRIIPVAGRVVSVFLKLVGVDGLDLSKLQETDVTAVLPAAMPALGAVFAQMPPGELEAITREMLRDATMNKLQLFGSPGGDAFDGLMQGRTMDAWKLLWHALEVWYPDFFASARGLLVRRAGSESSSETSDPSSTSGPATA